MTGSTLYRILEIWDEEGNPTGRVEVLAYSNGFRYLGNYDSMAKAMEAWPMRWHVFTAAEREDVEITDTSALLAEARTFPERA